MKVDIYIKEVNGNREIRIPWLPDELPFDTGEAAMASYEILNKGEVVVPTGVGLAEYSWESIFPGSGRTDKTLLHGTWKKPEYYHNILKGWKEKGTKLNLLVTGYPINKNVYITNYSGKASGAFGDIVYSVTFKEARKIVVTSVTVKTSKTNTSTRSSSPNEKKQKTSTYTVKSGDTLWSIAQKKLGSGAKWKKIYDANKSIIESTAKKRWKAAGKNRGSQNGKWIFPGTVLTIPS